MSEIGLIFLSYQLAVNKYDYAYLNCMFKLINYYVGFHSYIEGPLKFSTYTMVVI